MNELDLDSLLDGNLADVENLPDYVTPPTGIYDLGVKEAKFEVYTKKGKDGQPDQPNQVRIRIDYAVQSVVELEDPEHAVPVSAGSVFSDTYLYEEKGLAIFKRQAAKLLNVEQTELDAVSMRDIFIELQSIESIRASVVTKKNAQGYENTTVRPFQTED